MSKHDDKIAEAAFGAVRLVMSSAPRPTVSITPVEHVAIPSPIVPQAPIPVSHVSAPAYNPSTPTAPMIRPYAMGSGNTSQPAQQSAAQQTAIAAASRAFTIARLGDSKLTPIGRPLPAALTTHPATLAAGAFKSPAQKAAAAAVLATPIAQSGNAVTAVPDSNAARDAGYATSVLPADSGDGGSEPQYQANDDSLPGQSNDQVAVDDGNGQSVDWSMLDDGDGSVPTGAAALASLNASAVPGLKPNSAIQPAVAPAKVSLWTRFLAFLGFGPKSASASIHGEGELQSMVKSVVRRARNGDQNAMALMALVRDNAAKGHPKAQETFALLQEYVRTNPVSNPRIGADPDYVAMTQPPGTRWAGESLYPDAVALSHGPLLTNPRIGQMLTRFGGEDQTAIRFGIENRNTLRAAQHHGVRMGRILAHARRLQAVRMPQSSLTKFDHRVGWELGEY